MQKQRQNDARDLIELIYELARANHNIYEICTQAQKRLNQSYWGHFSGSSLLKNVQRILNKYASDVILTIVRMLYLKNSR